MSGGKSRFTYGGNVLGLGSLILVIYVGKLLDHVDPWLQWGSGGATAIFCIMRFAMESTVAKIAGHVM